MCLHLRMHKKIYFQHKPLFITDERTKEAEQLKDLNGYLFIQNFSNDKAPEIIKTMEKDTVAGIVVLHNDVEAAFESIKRHFKFLQAAGGLVHTENDEFLLIFRRDKWDLPKGKLDEGEAIESCALREAEEETGLRNAQLKDFLTVTYHTYYQNGEPVLKESHWYLIEAQHQALVPQTQEDIEECRWVKTSDLAVYLENTHPSIADVLTAGIEKLHAGKKI